MVSIGPNSACSGDSAGSDSPKTDSETYPYISEMVRTLGRNYRQNSFNESDSFLPRRRAPGFTFPLRSYDGSSRDILYGGMSEIPEDGLDIPATGNPDQEGSLSPSKIKVTANRGGAATSSRHTIELGSSSEETDREESPPAEQVNIEEEERTDEGVLLQEEEVTEEESAGDRTTSTSDVNASEGSPSEEAPSGSQNPASKKSKAKKKPEKTDEDEIPPPPKGLGPMPYSRLYGLGPGGFTKSFRRKYEIPDDVVVEAYTGSRLTYGEDFILLPLLAITEGGVRFPIHAFIRQFLHCYKLVPCQVAVNVYRILYSVMELARRNDIQRITLGDLMLMYQVGKNATHQRYFLSTLPYFDQVVTRLYDSEKWANVFVKVSGNFERGDPLEDRFSGEGVAGPFKIPRFKSTEVGKYLVNHLC